MVQLRPQCIIALVLPLSTWPVVVTVVTCLLALLPSLPRLRRKIFSRLFGVVLIIQLALAPLLPCHATTIGTAQKPIMAGRMAPSPRQHTYRGTGREIRNPERGFRHETQDMCGTATGGPAGLTKAQLQQIKHYNLTVVQTYCYLPLDSTISPDTLRVLRLAFAQLRAVGVKALWRFAYDRMCPGTNRYTAESIIHHIDQLAATVAANVDVIYVLQAGFIGCWGECKWC